MNQSQSFSDGRVSMFGGEEASAQKGEIIQRGPHIFEFPPDLAMKLGVYSEYNGSQRVRFVSPKALSDALDLAGALDAGYFNAEAIGAAIAEHASIAIKEATKFINEGDRKRGATLAIRGVQSAAMGAVLDGAKEVEQHTLYFTTDAYTGCLSYPSSFSVEESTEALKVATAMLKAGRHIEAGDKLGVDLNNGRTIVFSIESIEARFDTAPRAATKARKPAKRKAVKRRR